MLDDDVREIVAMLRRRRGGGPELLAHRDGRRWVDLKADDVNAYIKRTIGEGFTAKDFRTWNATALLAVALARRADGGESRAARARVVGAAVAEVASILGNTPAVCRRSYIDPRVIDRFDAGLTIDRRAGGRAGSGIPGRAGRRASDRRAGPSRRARPHRRRRLTRPRSALGG